MSNPITNTPSFDSITFQMHITFLQKKIGKDSITFETNEVQKLCNQIAKDFFVAKKTDLPAMKNVLMSTNILSEQPDSPGLCANVFLSILTAMNSTSLEELISKNVETWEANYNKPEDALKTVGEKVKDFFAEIQTENPPRTRSRTAPTKPLPPLPTQNATISLTQNDQNETPPVSPARKVRVKKAANSLRKKINGTFKSLKETMKERMPIHPSFFETPPPLPPNPIKPFPYFWEVGIDVSPISIKLPAEQQTRFDAFIRDHLTYLQTDEKLKQFNKQLCTHFFQLIFNRVKTDLAELKNQTPVLRSVENNTGIRMVKTEPLRLNRLIALLFLYHQQAINLEMEHLYLNAASNKEMLRPETLRELQESLNSEEYLAPYISEVAKIKFVDTSLNELVQELEKKTKDAETKMLALQTKKDDNYQSVSKLVEITASVNMFKEKSISLEIKANVLREKLEELGSKLNEIQNPGSDIKKIDPNISEFLTETAAKFKRIKALTCPDFECYPEALESLKTSIDQLKQTNSGTRKFATIKRIKYIPKYAEDSSVFLKENSFSLSKERENSSEVPKEDSFSFSEELPKWLSDWMEDTK